MWQYACVVLTYIFRITVNMCMLLSSRFKLQDKTMLTREASLHETVCLRGCCFVHHYGALGWGEAQCLSSRAIRILFFFLQTSDLGKCFLLVGSASKFAVLRLPFTSTSSITRGWNMFQAAVCWFLRGWWSEAQFLVSGSIVLDGAGTSFNDAFFPWRKMYCVHAYISWVLDMLK